MDSITAAAADDAETLRREIRRLGPWHHDVEIAPGVRTGDPALAGDYPTALGTPSIVDPVAETGMLLREIYRYGLEGRSFLDCACNAGGHVFGARAAGAGRAYGFDAREHWIRQAAFLKQHLPAHDMEFQAHRLEDLPARGLDPFDVTLFRGIFYHLPDPVAGLRIAADLTREIIVVNTASAPAPVKGLVLSRESETEVMSGVDGLAWLPTGPDVVREALAWCGLAHSRVRFDFSVTPGVNRFEVIAARRGSALDHYDIVRPEPALGPAATAGLLSRLRRRLRGR